MAVARLTGIRWRREQREVLRGIDWVIERGQHWALIGANGSGKTSLLNILNGYVWPTQGKVEVLGCQFGRCDLRQVRRRIGWVNAAFGEQFEQRYPDEPAVRVVESGRFASISLYEQPSAEDEARARALLKAFQCEHLADAPLATLSQGERQRVLLARAWMAEPELLILDEPCNGLDLLARETLLGAIQTLASQPDGPTIIYVTHHVEEIVPAITHALVLKDGSVLAQGPIRDTITEAVLSHAFSVPIRLDHADGRYWVRLRTERGLIPVWRTGSRGHST
ncbi:putative ABC transporter ATP-binding protein YlmA [Alicyclobacillus cellulosilyticus]|uniref:ABC transporter ATP-binding protein YlmA n=1 Tax=Alicyclobacillus cellulosilyticus TaxID=1003997 RepID=A0A917K932_9BACL|nr:ABC transporter ATP-binding protein [Alicyclobacillus cellulosilyticus]GGJ03140.1 putative ABC transporter ATP-binding protein YlmA [Alicyclobacillus cellulosilyticus]